MRKTAGPDAESKLLDRSFDFEFVPGWMRKIARSDAESKSLDRAFGFELVPR